MDNGITKVNINQMPKWFKAMLAIVSIFSGLLLISTKLDNDFYFLYPTGEYILNNGLPVKDFLSMHSSMDIIVQQWLADVLFYLIYTKLGKAGIIALVYLIYICFGYIIFKLNKLVTDNVFISSTCAFVTNAVMAPMFFVSRPQIFTYLIIAFELYTLEKYVKTKKAAYLAIIPVLSLIMINQHAAMWLMIFVFMAPYFVGAVTINIKKIRFAASCKLTPLVITAIVAFVAGFANPYGVKAMLYITTSFGYEEISNLINEMAPLNMGNKTDMIGIAIIAATIIIMLIYQKKLNVRFLCLYIGTLILSIVSSKSLAYFLIAGMLAFAYHMRDFSFNLKISTTKTKGDTKKRTVLISMLIVLTCVLIFGLYYNSANPIDNTENTNAKFNYTALDEIVEIIEKDDSTPILYTGFDYGQYLEYKGYHPYIDGRAELFVKDNNNDYDYMMEYYNLMNGKLYYKDFVDRYDFNYLIVTTNEPRLYYPLSKDSEYKMVYNSKSKDETIALFEKINK